MEVNNLTYRIYQFLTKKSWVYIGKNDSKFIYLTPNEVVGLPKGFELKLPINNKSKDFYNYMSNILEFIKDLYSDNEKINKFVELNEKLKHRFTNQWILPEEKSKIHKMDKFDVFIPE